MSKRPLVLMAVMLGGCGLLLPLAEAAGIKPIMAQAGLRPGYGGQAGQSPQGLSLKPVSPGEVALAEVVAGSPCWRSSPAQGISGLGFVADERFRVPGPAPVAVRVEYLDRGRGSFALVYAAVDSSGRTGLKWSRKVTKQNSGQWRQTRLQLTDAHLTRPGGWYLRVDALTERPGEDEEYVRRVAASIEGVELQVAHPLLGADGQSQTQ
ncbi:MAG: hypothetical protein MUP62_05730, partial [Dehalococcoidia bacterium]|nr:hypothetical protein [Dehalococcoidia bacterium]